MRNFVFAIALFPIALVLVGCTTEATRRSSDSVEIAVEAPIYPWGFSHLVGYGEKRAKEVLGSCCNLEQGEVQSGGTMGFVGPDTQDLVDFVGNLYKIWPRNKYKAAWKCY